MTSYVSEYQAMSMRAETDYWQDYDCRIKEKFKGLTLDELRFDCERQLAVSKSRDISERHRALAYRRIELAKQEEKRRTI